MDVYSKFEGKEVFHCYSMGKRINFNADSISLCHGIEVGDVCLKKGVDSTITPQWYYEAVDRIICKCQDDNYKCHRCSNLKKLKYETDQIKVVTINTSRKCNSKCVYCPVCMDHSGSCYDPLPYIINFIESKVIAGDCFFDWGGGEPVLNRFFEPTFEYLMKKGYYQRVNSNCIEFSPVVEYALKKGTCELRTSLDAGTKDAFLRVKGVDCFEKCCSNIEKYILANAENVEIKYVLNSSNSDEESVRGFIAFCSKIGVKRVCLDADSYSYSQRNYYGPLFFTDKEIKAAHLFCKLAQNENIKVQIGYVYSAGRENDSRDFNSTKSIKSGYSIPDEPIKKEWRGIFTKGRYATVCASLKALKKEVGQAKVVLIGRFTVSKVIKHALKEVGIDVYRQILLKNLEDQKFINQMIGENPNLVFIVANEQYEKCMTAYNNLENDKLNNKIICMDTFRYIESLKDYSIRSNIIKFLRKIHMMW